MNAYADTGFLCSLHAPDAHTGPVLRRMQRQTLPLPLTSLHRIELRNAFHLRVFRKEITAGQRDLALNALLADLAGGALTAADPAFGDMANEAERLSALHSDKLGTRSLDILHVASALVLGLPEFLAFDMRQRALAKAVGLRVPELT